MKETLVRTREGEEEGGGCMWIAVKKKKKGEGLQGELAILKHLYLKF